MIAFSMIKEWKLLARDLHGLAVLFVMPIAFMLIMSLALSRDAEPHAGSQLVLLGETDYAVNQKLADKLAQENIHITLLPSAVLAEQQKRLQSNGLQMLIVNPNTSKTPLRNNQPLQLFVPPDTESAWLMAMKGLLQQHYSDIRLNHYFDQVGDLRIDEKGLPAKIKREMEDKINEKSTQRFEQVEQFLQSDLLNEHYLSNSGKTVAKPNSVQHSVPAWLIFGMFFIMIPLSNVMALEKQTNTLTRLRLARASASGLLFAKLLPYFIINQLQFIGMLWLGRHVLPYFDAPALLLHGDWQGYAVLAIAVSLAALGYALLMSVCAKSTEHAVVLGGGGIILMAAIGGIMVPSHLMPETMQTLSQISPMAWGLQAFEQLLLNHSNLAGIAAQIGYLLAFACVCLTLATLIYRRQLRTQARF
ncbi:MAG: ABC transporter permease [Neisseria sp.]|nr:ABC transporter permease [Neisseria sp.]